MLWRLVSVMRGVWEAFGAAEHPSEASAPAPRASGRSVLLGAVVYAMLLGAAVVWAV